MDFPILQKLFLLTTIVLSSLCFYEPKSGVAMISENKERKNESNFDNINRQKIENFKQKTKYIAENIYEFLENFFAKQNQHQYHIHYRHLLPNLKQKNEISAKSFEMEDDFENMDPRPRIFKKYVEILIKFIQHKNRDVEAFRHTIKFDTIFKNKGILLKIEGNGDVVTISNDTTITLNLCHVHNNRRWHFLNGVYFLRCVYKRSPPKKAAYKVKLKERVWIYPLIPQVTAFELGKADTFIFPDLETMDEMEKGAFGLKFIEETTKDSKVHNLNRLFRILLNIIFNESMHALIRQKREIIASGTVHPNFVSPDLIHSVYKGVFEKTDENDNSVQSLNDALARAAKATDHIAGVDPHEDFWNQLLNKTVTILHYIHGIDIDVARNVLNSTLSLAKYFVDDLATIKSCADETQSFINEKLEKLGLKFIKKNFGEERAIEAIEEKEKNTIAASKMEHFIKSLQENLQKTRQNMEEFYYSAPE